jgi:hypothetical protein
MRIPNAGEFLAIFAATGQLSDFSKLRKFIIIALFMAV